MLKYLRLANFIKDLKKATEYSNQNVIIKNIQDEDHSVNELWHNIELKNKFYF